MNYLDDVTRDERLTAVPFSEAIRQSAQTHGIDALLIAAIMVALVAIVVKLAAGESEGTGASAVPYETAVTFLPGERLANSSVERGQIYLRLLNEESGAARIIVIRASDGMRIGEVLLQETP